MVVASILHTEANWCTKSSINRDRETKPVVLSVIRDWSYEENAEYPRSSGHRIKETKFVLNFLFCNHSIISKDHLKIWSKYLLSLKYVRPLPQITSDTIYSIRLVYIFLPTQILLCYFLTIQW